MDKNFITRIRVPNAITNQDVLPAIPELKNVINVVCGQNNTGKSYLFKALDAIMNGKNAGQHYFGYEVEYHHRGASPRFYSSIHISRFKEKAGVISKNFERIDPNKKADPRNLTLSFFFDQIISNARIPAKYQFHGPKEKWMEDHQTRNKYIEKFTTDEEIVFPCESRNGLVQFVENAFKSMLVFRRPNENIELALKEQSGLVVPFPLWSDGQKTLFYVGLCIFYWKPDVILIDEIENHLHPDYMSKLLALIKERVPQTFIASHHPHVIFSDFTDKVFYLESVNEQQHYVSRGKRKSTPLRRIYTLDSAFEKLAHVYKLFDPHDNQLLKQATRVSSVCDIELYSALLKVFVTGVAPPSKRPLPDRQTLDIISLITKPLVGESVILDFGAGLGRVLEEVLKLNGPHSIQRAKWILWEPNAQTRTELRRRIDSLNLGACVVVPDELSEVQCSSVDVTLVTNVVHELSPRLFSKLLISTVSLTKKPDGIILFTELYPLLHAEKYAVAYEAANLNSIFASLGYASTRRQFPVLDSGGYTLSVLVEKELEMGEEEIVSRIDNLWDKIVQSNLSSYHARSGLSDYSDYRATLHDLTTIASIQAWKNGFWK